jgi:hypothetical protein
MKTLLQASLLALVCTASAELAPGGTGYTKKASTDLLAGAERSAKVVATLPISTKVKIVAQSDRWLQVESSAGKGWIYSGNLSEDKPAVERQGSLVAVSADNATAAIATRPLDAQARAYAQRQGKGDAASDILWMERQADSVTAAQVNAYLKSAKKGEFAK